jgi:hypothetical protein
MGGAVLLLFLTALGARAEDAVTSVSLGMPVDARAAGMGEAYASISGEPSCLYYNPAGVADIGERQLSLSFQRGLTEDTLGDFLFVRPSTRSALAAGLIAYDGGSMELNDNRGNARTVRAQRDVVAVAGYGRRLQGGWYGGYPGINLLWLRRVSLGADIKVLRSNFAEEVSATAAAVDLGALGRFGRFSAGISIQNLGTALRYDGEKTPLPFTIRSGVSYEMKIGTIAADIDRRNGGNIDKRLGLDYRLGSLALRAGYAAGDGLNSASLGLGCRWSKFRFDYAIRFLGDIGQFHLATFSMKV